MYTILSLDITVSTMISGSVLIALIQVDYLADQFQVDFVSDWSGEIEVPTKIHLK